MRLSEVRAGDVLVSDEGFTCMAVGQRHVVHEDDVGLWIACWCGRHYLDGQTAFDERDRLVGLTRGEK